MLIIFCELMGKIRFIAIAICLLVFTHTSHIVYASSFVEIQVGSSVSFQIPRNWVILSGNKTITLNSFLESVQSVSSEVRFQANLKNDNGIPITTVQFYKWNSNFSQPDIVEMESADVNGYDQEIHKQMQRELKLLGGILQIGLEPGNKISMVYWC